MRKQEKRKFNQTIDLIINLKAIDVKKDNIYAVIVLPHKIKDKKICAFLTNKSDLINTVTKDQFPLYKDKKALKKIAAEYDFFIAHASLMPLVATTFGKVLGPSGKMPTPQLGMIVQEIPEQIKLMIEKVSKSIKLRVKEASVKVAIGKENMKDEEIIDNARAIYDGLVNSLPTKRENVKKVLIKLTMGKPVEAEIK